MLKIILLPFFVISITGLAVFISWPLTKKYLALFLGKTTPRKRTVILIFINILCLIGVADFCYSISHKFNHKADDIESRIETSKLQPWPSQYKANYIKECLNGIIKSAGGELSLSSRETASNFCSCITEKTEKAHIIPILFNNKVETESDYQKHAAAKIKAWFNTNEGKSALIACKR